MSNVSSAEKISNEQSAELILESEVQCCLDLGSSFLYKLLHPKLGPVVVVDSSVGSCGLLRI